MKSCSKCNIKYIPTRVFLQLKTTDYLSFTYYYQHCHKAGKHCEIIILTTETMLTNAKYNESLSITFKTLSITVKHCEDTDKLYYELAKHC